MVNLDLSHGLSVQPTALVAAWPNVVSRLIFLLEIAPMNPLQGLLRASTEYGMYSIGERTIVCKETVHSLHTQDIPNSVLIV